MSAGCAVVASRKGRRPPHRRWRPSFRSDCDARKRRDRTKPHSAAESDSLGSRSMGRLEAEPQLNRSSRPEEPTRFSASPVVHPRTMGSFTLPQSRVFVDRWAAEPRIEDRPPHSHAERSVAQVASQFEQGLDVSEATDDLDIPQHPAERVDKERNSGCPAENPRLSVPPIHVHAAR